jgi:hypothetical protein
MRQLNLYSQISPTIFPDKNPPCAIARFCASEEIAGGFNAHSAFAHLLKHIHDICVVLSSPAKRMANVESDLTKLVHRVY